VIRKQPKENRKQKRSHISVPVNFSAEDGGPPESSKPQEGTTADMSESGLSLFSNKELTPGIVLEIECRDIWPSPKKFTVQWCNRVRFNFYRVGLLVKE
jgi:hypothetical protein